MRWQQLQLRENKRQFQAEQRTEQQQQKPNKANRQTKLPLPLPQSGAKAVPEVEERGSGGSRQTTIGKRHKQRGATVLVIKWQTRNYGRLRNVRATCTRHSINTHSQAHTHSHILKVTYKALTTLQQRGNNKLMARKIKYEYSPHSLRFINLRFTHVPQRPHEACTHTHTHTKD